MTKEIKIVFAYFIILSHLCIIWCTKLFADCTGCGDDGHKYALLKRNINTLHI